MRLPFRYETDERNVETERVTTHQFPVSKNITGL